MNNITNNQNLSYYNQRFAVVGNGNYFTPGREIWVNRIRSRGFEAKGFDDFESFKEYNPTCVIVFGITQHPKPNDRKKIWVAIQTEHFYHPKTGGIHHTPQWLKKSLPLLKAYDIIMDFSRTNIDAIERSGKKLRKKNILLHPLCSLGEFSVCTNSAIEKEYDILFIGWHSRIAGSPYSRRGIILEELMKKYKLYPLSNDLWGEEKQKAIRQSKICLNLHYEESRFIEIERMLDYSANHAFIMSDRIFDSTPFVDGEDYVSFFLTDLEDRIDYYLSHDEERQKIADHAFQKVKQLSEDSGAVDLVLDAVLLEADRKNYPREMRSWRRRRLRYRIYKHLPEKIRDKIM